jgi:hypothetical protein
VIKPHSMVQVTSVPAIHPFSPPHRHACNKTKKNHFKPYQIMDREREGLE